MTCVELQFPFTGTTLPSDQGYGLYGAISRIIPEAHSADWLAIETVPGAARGDGVTQLDQQASLKIRIPQDWLGDEASVVLQKRGMENKRKIGCGFLESIKLPEERREALKQSSFLKAAFIHDHLSASQLSRNRVAHFRTSSIQVLNACWLDTYWHPALGRQIVIDKLTLTNYDPQPSCDVGAWVNRSAKVLSG